MRNTGKFLLLCFMAFTLHILKVKPNETCREQNTPTHSNSPIGTRVTVKNQPGVDDWNRHLLTIVPISAEEWIKKRTNNENDYISDEPESLIEDLFDYLIPKDFKLLGFILDEELTPFDKWIRFLYHVLDVFQNERTFRQNIRLIRLETPPNQLYHLFERENKNEKTEKEIEYEELYNAITETDNKVASYKNTLITNLLFPLPLHEEVNISLPLCKKIVAAIQGELDITVSPFLEWTCEDYYGSISDEKFNRFAVTFKVLEELLKMSPDNLNKLHVSVEYPSLPLLVEKTNTLTGRQRKLLATLVQSIVTTMYVVHFAHKEPQDSLLSRLNSDFREVERKLSEAIST